MLLHDSITAGSASFLPASVAVHRPLRLSSLSDVDQPLPVPSAFPSPSTSMSSASERATPLPQAGSNDSASARMKVGFDLAMHADNASGRPAVNHMISVC